jgi:protoporphyrinogen oxidase
MITILGAGLAGLSCSYHLGHGNCEIFDANSYAGGHIYSHQRDGFTWDEGPHVSFTQNPYVRELFEQSVQGDFLDYPVEVSNYFRGSWIPHPAQANLYAVPEPIRTECLNNFLESRGAGGGASELPKNYEEWLNRAFGQKFAEIFPAAYTRKYWTAEPAQLTTDWVGDRVFLPNVKDVVEGYEKPPAQSAHYIKTVRYPVRGGYMSFATQLVNNAQLFTNHRVSSIDLESKTIAFSNGVKRRYERLINTIPLPVFVKLANAPSEILAAADNLSCTSLLLVNVIAPHETKKPYHWMYVYDENKLSTRINCVELLSPNNGQAGKTGVQVEVYASRNKPLKLSIQDIAQQVCAELIEMGLIDEVESVHTQFNEYANVLFDHRRRDSMEIIFCWLEQFGLRREKDDLDPMTYWGDRAKRTIGDIALAGRFGQWKYFWSDDCVLRGRQIAESSY